jgi:hypothetical protein
MLSTALLFLARGAAADAPTTYVVDGSRTSFAFDGHGGLSAGGTSRLLVDYPKKQQSEILGDNFPLYLLRVLTFMFILDYLFKPNFGAGLGVLKLEIGGDTQATDGTEPSHMHSNGDLSCSRGYEGWLAKEARARNPAIKIWSLSWGIPGWINGSVIGNDWDDDYGPKTHFFSEDNIRYQVQWVKCLREQYNVESDYIGIWNERPQGSADYVVDLRRALDASGFSGVGITIEASWQTFVNKLPTNATLDAAVAAVSAHYPCNASARSATAMRARKKFWAGEDTPDNSEGPGGNWSGAGCWGRKLNQHWIKMNSTSSVAWSALWAAYPGISLNFLGNGFINCTEPWSGHYDVPPVLWVNAHWNQFANPGWRFLQAGPDGGSGMLAGGGSYVTLVPPPPPPRDSQGGVSTTALLPSGVASSGSGGTFTMIVETLDGSCGKQGHCNVGPITATQSLAFALRGPLAATTTVHLWCSSSSQQFVYKGLAKVSNGALVLDMAPDTICTATTLSNLANGTKGTFPVPPPASARFPAAHSDNFSSYSEDALAWGFADVYGSFAVRGTRTSADSALTQVATAVPTGWAPKNWDPLTVIGDEQWTDFQLDVSAFVNHTDTQPYGPHYLQLCGGCGGANTRGIKFACPGGCCFNISWAGKWSVGHAGGPLNGTIAGFADTWHHIGMTISDGTLSAVVDGSKVVEVQGSCPSRGMVGLGCGKYHMCGFRDFSVRKLPKKTTPLFRPL